MASLRNPLFTLDAAPSQETMQALANDGKSSLRRGWEAGRLSTDINALAADEMSLRANGDIQGAENLRLQRQGLEAARAGVAPQVQSLAQINSLGSGLDWAAGQVGQGAASMVDPLMAAGSVQGLGRLAGMTKTPLGRAVELATQFAAPATAYGINQRQLTGEFGADVMNDPTLADKISAQDLNRQANTYGLGAAALDTLLPAAAARRMVGTGTLRALDRMPLGARAGLDLVGEGTTEALQAKGSQLMKSGINPNRDTTGDTQELIDSFAGGFVGAGPVSLASNMAQAGHDRLSKTGDVIGKKAGDVADLATGTVTEAAQKGKGLLARAVGVFRRGDAAGEDLGEDAAPEVGKPQASGIQFDKADIDYLNSMPEGVDPMDDLKSRVKMAQRYLPQFQDDPEAQDLLAQIQEGARAGDIDMLGSAVDAASTKIAQRHNQDDLIRRAEQGTPAEQLARIAGGLATRGVKAAAKGAFKVGKAAVEGVTAAATKKNMQGAEQTEGGLGDALGGYLADKASTSPLARRSSKLPTHFKRLGEDLGDLIDSFERSPGKKAAGKAADKMRLGSMTPQLMRHAIAVARDMEAAFGRDAALTHVEEMQLLTKQGQPVFKALRGLLSDDQTRNLSAHMAQHEMQSAMEMVRLLPDKARAELAGSAQLRSEFLGAVDRVATGRATAKQRQLLEQAVGGPKVLNGLLSAYSGQMEDPETEAEQGGEKTAAAIEDDEGEQFGEDYEAGKQSGAEKALANGAAPKLYGFDRTPTLKAGTKERPDPFRGKDLPNLFDPERILHKQSPDDPDVRALDKRLADMAEQLRLKGTEGDDGHRYQVSAKSALTVMKERGYTPEQVLDTYRRYRSKVLAEALKSKDSPLSADDERALRKLLSDLSATLDAAVPTGTDPNALPAPKRLGLPDLKEFSSYDELPSEERAALDKDRRAGRMQTRARFRRGITGAADLGNVSADRLRDLYASALEFFDYHKVAVAEQLSDRLVERMEPAELSYLVEKASRAVEFARKATADRFKDLVEAAPTAEPDEILAMQEEARLAGAEVFDNNNIITFESTTLATRGERKGKPVLLHMRADDLARWAAKQRREQKSADFEKNADKNELSDESRDSQFLKDLASGIAAVLASGDVRDTMPYKITAVGGKVTKQRFAEDSIPDSLTLPTETMGDREAGRAARAESFAQAYRESRAARKLPMHDRRPMKVSRTISLYEGGKKVGQKTALVDNPKRDQREWVGHQGAVARDQDSAPTGSDDSIDSPIDEGPIQTIQRTGLTALERAQLANIPTLAGRMRAFATKEADEAVAEARDVGPIRETDADMIADGAKEAAREIFSLTGVAAGKFNAAPRGAKTGNLGLSPLDFFDKLEAPETPDEFADQRYTSRTQGFDATAGARPMENKGQALAMAKSRGMELAQEGLDAIARRIRTARRDKTGDLVGAPHYIFAAAAALTGDNLSMMDLSASEMERAVDMRGEVATVLNEMAPKDALAGARLLFDSPNISLSQYRKMLAEEIDSSPTAVAARATKLSPAELEAQKARREAEKAKAEAKAEALAKDIAQFEDQLSKVKESLVRREDDDTAGRKADTLRADVLRMKIDRAQNLRAKALAKLDEAPTAEAPKPAAPARDPAFEKEVMDRLMNERYDFKTAAEVDKFLKAGYAMWQRGKAAEANLRKQRADLEATEGFDQAKHAQLNKAIEMIDVLDETFAMGAAAHTDLGSFYDGVEGEWKDDKEARAMLKGAAPEVAAQAPKSQGAPSGARNAQAGATGDNSQEAMIRAKEYLHKVLPGVRLEFRNLTGYSGEWIEAENVVRVSTTSAPGVLQTTYHEAMHAFFSKFVQANPQAKRVLASLVNHGPTLDRLVALLDGHPAAQAQLANAEERLAYAYQFWAAGLLDLPGTSGKSFFAKVKKFLRRVAGAISDHERAADILIAFHEGKLAQPSAAGQVVGKIIAQGTMNLKARRRMDRTIQWAYSRVAPAETVLARSPSATAQKLAKELFTNPGDEGSAGLPEGYLNARRTSYTRFNNRMARIVKDLGERDSAQVLKYLQDEAELADIPFAPHREAVREIRKLLRDFYNYSVEKGVELQDRGEKYFPIVWDFSKLMDKRAEFINLVTTKYGRDGEAVWDALTGVTDPARDNKRDPDRADGVLSPFFAGKEEVTLDFFEPADRQKFLQDSLVGTLSNYFHQGARNAEYTQRFGAKGEVLNARLNSIGNELRKHAAEELAAGRFADKKQADAWADRQLQLVQDSVGAIEGSLGKDTAHGWRKATSWLTAYQNLRLLPLTLFASFVDPLGMVARGATMREAYDSFLRGMREVFTQWGDMFRDQPKQRQLDRWEKLAEDIGAVDAVMLSHHVAEEYSSGYMAPGAKKVNDWLFRLNGMEAWNRGMRVGATKAATRFIVQHATRPEFHSERWLKELGLTKDDVHLDADGELVLSPKALEAAGMPKDQAREAAVKLRNAVNRWVEGAVLTPNAAQRPAWASDPRWSFMFHLKQFSYSFHQTLLKRAVKEMNYGNLAPMGAFAWYVPAMMASDITKGLIQGGGSLPTHMQGWTLGDHVMHGIERAGFLGIGAVGVDASQDIWSLGGPAIEQVIDAMVDPAGQTVLRAMPLNGIYAELVR